MRTAILAGLAAAIVAVFVLVRVPLVQSLIQPAPAKPPEFDLQRQAESFIRNTGGVIF